MPDARALMGANRLKQALRALKDQWLITEATWGDSVRRKFEDRYLAPIDPAVDAAVHGMQKMAEVLEHVRRDCSDRSETP